MSRKGELTKEQLKNIEAFRYQTCGLTPLEIYVYEPFWNFLANHCLPDWLAPNALTLLGLVMPLASLVSICVLDPSFTQTLPCWVWLLAWFADFWYQTIDAIDGKQARRTNNCSPLGQILDHSLDQITFTCMMIHVCSTLRIGDDIVRILLIAPGVMSAHYSIEYRTHFTKMHQTVIGFIGATEQLLFVQGPTLAAFFIEDSNAYLDWKVTLPYVEYETTLKDIVITFAFLTGLHYNIENILVSLFKADDKLYALGCIIPYVQFFAMLYASSYSPLFHEYPIYFLILCGSFLLWVNTIFNLCSTASAQFNWLFFEPLIFFGTLYAEVAGLISRNQAIAIYIGFCLTNFARYVIIMKNLVNQICSYMGLSFLKVKPLTKTRRD